MIGMVINSLCQIWWGERGLDESMHVGSWVGNFIGR
jgi:hypothetical protein